MRGSEKVEAQIQKARRGSVAAGSDVQLQRAIGQFIDRNLSQTLRDFGIVKEKVEILTGERGKIEDAAIRRGSMKALSQMPAMKAAKVTSAPTAEQYNALLSDVQSIHQSLSVIADLLAARSR